MDLCCYVNHFDFLEEFLPIICRRKIRYKKSRHINRATKKTIERITAFLIYLLWAIVPQQHIVQ